MTEEYQQPPPPQQQYQPAPQQFQPQPKVELTDHFVGEGKLGMFLMLGALVLFIGAMILNLCYSGILDGDIRSLRFIGALLVDMGIIVIITLLILGGIQRDDMNESVRSMMLRAAGFGLGLYVLAWSIRIMTGSGFGF